MRNGRGLLALAVLALSAAAAPAQGYLAGPSFGSGGFTYTRQSRHSLFSLTVGGFAGPSYSSSGTLCGPAYGYGGPVFVPLSPPPVVVGREAPVVVMPARPGRVAGQLAPGARPR